MSKLDEKLLKLNEKRERLLAEEKALKVEMRRLEGEKKAVSRKNRNRDLILFGAEFFQKSRLDYETEYKGFLEYLQEGERMGKLIDDFRLKRSGSIE